MAVWDRAHLCVEGHHDVVDVTGEVELFNRLWATAKSEHRPVVWVERRPSGLWRAGVDILTASVPPLAQESYEALQRLCAALVASGQATDAAYGRDRAIAEGLLTVREAQVVAGVLADLFAGHTRAGVCLQRVLAALNRPVHG
ncbi:hypothetical protein [Streptomyces sp. NPDC001380]|uniref:hypothetical protein n=1 Tax=Streptomyces sp. NPDC001380 TaxID=3364566 RepID=UPI0036BB11C8